MLKYSFVCIFIFISLLAHAKPTQIVITGGPGVGKSSVLHEIEIRGEKIVREAATDLIELYRARGNQEPWLLPNFQTNISLIQLRRENDLENIEGPVFLDRSLIDGLGYMRHFHQSIPQQLEPILLDPAISQRYFPLVFVIQNIGESFVNETRREDLSESQLIEKALKDTYTELGYRIIEVPKDTVENRVNLIFSILAEQGILDLGSRSIPLL